MKKILHLLLLIVGGLVFNGCTKDSDVFIPDPGQIIGPDEKWYTDVNTSMFINKLQKELLIATDVDSFENDNNSHSIYFESGLLCNFPANAFVDMNGNPVDGKVQVEALLLKKKGDLIRMYKPTVSDGEVLVSDGCFFIDAKKNGAKLQLAVGKKITARLSRDDYSADMEMFLGNGMTGNEFNWIQDTLSLNQWSVVDMNYKILVSGLGWVNCDYFYNLSSEKVTVKASMPENFTNANTESFLVFNNLQAVLALKSDYGSKCFKAENIPVGQSVTLVTITKEGNFYYLGHNGFVTSNSSSNYQNININPARVSFTELTNYLNNL